MMLSDRDIKNRIIQDQKDVIQAKEWWEKAEWDKIGDKIVIDPFNTNAIGPCTYDLSVGEEYRSLREPNDTKKLEEGGSIHIGPGESILVLSEEYICLPKNVVAMIVPRARWMFEGTSICATRIDPTWYGKLLVVFTNSAKNPVELYRHESFCTCCFMEISKVETHLIKDKVHFLGRTKIGRIKFQHALNQKLLIPEKVGKDDIEKVVDLYGWPWDVVRGMFKLTLNEIIDYIEKETAPTIIDEATSASIKKAYESQQNWLKVLIVGILSIGASGIGLVGYLVYLLVSRP